MKTSKTNIYTFLLQYGLSTHIILYWFYNTESVNLIPVFVFPMCEIYSCIENKRGLHKCISGHVMKINTICIIFITFFPINTHWCQLISTYLNSFRYSARQCIRVCGWGEVTEFVLKAKKGSGRGKGDWLGYTQVKIVYSIADGVWIPHSHIPSAWHENHTHSYNIYYRLKSKIYTHRSILLSAGFRTYEALC